MKTKWVGVVLLLAGAVFAEPGRLGGSRDHGGPGGPGGGLSPQVEQSMRQIESGLGYLRAQVNSVPYYARRQLVMRLNRAGYEMDDLIQALEHGPGPGNQSGWFAAQGQECTNFCRSIGMNSGVSREGAQCVSGENRAASAVGIIPFTYGCWPNCAGETFSNASSVGGYCYKPGQKQEGDRTDITVGCFCR